MSVEINKLKSISYTKNNNVIDDNTNKVSEWVVA